MLPSSSLGRNSVPSRDAEHAAHREEDRGAISAATPIAAHGERQDRPGRPCGCARTRNVSTSLTLLRQQDRRQHRRDGEGGDDGAEQRIGIGARHRAEDLALDALHGEQRQERRDGDDHREEDRLVDLDGARSGCGAACRSSRASRSGCLRARMVRQMAEDVLHHDDGRIDDDAEIDGADRQQVGGFAAQHRDDDGEEQRHRNRRRRRSARSADCRETPTGSGRSARRRTACCAARCCTVIATRSPRS